MHARCDGNCLRCLSLWKLDSLVAETVVCANSCKQVLVFCVVSQYINCAWSFAGYSR
jgi:hypothetical protein